jgi:hypothetical protein
VDNMLKIPGFFLCRRNVYKIKYSGLSRKILGKNMVLRNMYIRLNMAGRPAFSNYVKGNLCVSGISPLSIEYISPAMRANVPRFIASS